MITRADPSAVHCTALRRLSRRSLQCGQTTRCGRAQNSGSSQGEWADQSSCPINDHGDPMPTRTTGPGHQRRSLEWMSALPHTKIECCELPPTFAHNSDLPVLLDRLRNGGFLDRRRSLVILTSRCGIRSSLLCRLLRLSNVARIERKRNPRSVFQSDPGPRISLRSLRATSYRPILCGAQRTFQRASPASRSQDLGK